MKKDRGLLCSLTQWDGKLSKNRRFLSDLLPHRYRVGMQFGYSSTAIPTILSGEKPTVHKHLSFYYYAPDKSPFKMMKRLGLGLLPSSIADRWRVRHILSKIVAKYYGYTGYFELYAMPFTRLPFFDYIDKTNIFVPGGLRPVKNIAKVFLKREGFHTIYPTGGFRRSRRSRPLPKRSRKGKSGSPSFIPQLWMVSFIV